MTVENRYLSLREEIDAVCDECSREKGAVKLLAVSKNTTIENIVRLSNIGCRDFGENRVESLAPKYEELTCANWHFIGNIQSRKITEIVRCSTLIHSLDNLKHAAKINDVAKQLNKKQRVLIECNTSGELSKGGIDVNDLEAFVEACCSLENIEVSGLMTMAPQSNMDAVKRCFFSLRCAFDKIKEQYSCNYSNISMNELSMGMSDDWKIAIEQGSTIVRVGRAIFSDGF